MKKIFLLVTVCIYGITGKAETVRQDTLTNGVKNTIEGLYNRFLPMLDRIEFTGNGEICNELKRRWNIAINHLKNNKEQMSDDVLNLLVSPSGQKIDMDMLKRFVNINDKDSITKIEINPDFIIDELKILGEKITNEMTRMAEQK